MKYRVVVEQSDEGYSAHVPGLPGCGSQGESEEEALANIRDAIEEYLSVRDELVEGAEVREVDVPV
jgi:predicted RNase H-like HicB family nuclease